MTAEEVARGIIGKTGREGYAYTVVDPSMFATSGGPSLAERMIQVGLVGLRRGDNRRVGQVGFIGGWDQMRARIKGDGERPMLYVFSTCRDFIRTVPALQHDPDRPEDLDTAGEDHAADECRYACMSRPYIPTPAPPPKPDEYHVTINPNGTVSYTEGFSVFNWAEARRRKRERGREHLSGLAEWLTQRPGQTCSPMRSRIGGRTETASIPEKTPQLI